MSQVRTGRTLGILGAGRGCGVTHLAVWMANYLAGAKRKRTAVLEWNDHGDIGRLLYFCKGAGDGKGNMADAKEPPASGRVWEVDYFPKAGPRQLADCLDRDYARVLVDYGELTGESLLECTRCDQKIIVGSFTEWQAEAFLDVMCRERKRDGSWSYAAAFGSEEARREAERRFRIPVRRIPFSSDAFAVTRADMRFFSELLGERAGRR